MVNVGAVGLQTRCHLGIEAMGITLNPDNLDDQVGSNLGTSDWLLIDQDRVNAFADDTLDHQFIHVDPEAAAKTPFGGTIAHGFLTLSLLSHFAGTAIGCGLDGTVMGVNYGLDKVRFLSPVKVGQRIRATGTLLSAEQKRPGQFLIKQEVVIEIEGEDKPALIAEWLTMAFQG